MNYMKKFIKDEGGIETIEFIGLVAVAAILIGVIVTIGTRMNTTAGNAKDSLDTSMGKVDSMIEGSGSGKSSAAEASNKLLGH